MGIDIIAGLITALSGGFAVAQLISTATSRFVRRKDEKIKVTISGVEVTIDLSDTASVQRAVAALTAAKGSTPDQSGGEDGKPS